MASTTTEFLTYLASRCNNELALCDVTWALCQSSETFLRIWMRFFFGEDFDISKITGFHRELPDSQGMGARADFVIYMKDEPKPYVIEVKIYDEKHHFEQYEKAYNIPQEHLGYIVNYTLDPDKVKKWSDFVDELKKKEIPEEEKSLIDGYCEYVNRVCHIMKAEHRIELDKTASLYDLILLFGELVDKETSFYISKGYSTKWEATIESRRAYMEVIYKNDTENWGRVWPFIGLFYDKRNPRIVAGFEKESGWGRPVYEFLARKTDLIGEVQTQYCSLEIQSAGFFWQLSDSAKEKFNHESLDGQRDILVYFLEEVLSFPAKVLEKCR